MEQLPVGMGARRNEDIALDLLKFVAVTASVGRPTTPTAGFVAAGNPKPKIRSVICWNSIPAVFARSKESSCAACPIYPHLELWWSAPESLVGIICASGERSKMQALQSVSSGSSNRMPSAATNLAAEYRVPVYASTVGTTPFQPNSRMQRRLPSPPRNTPPSRRNSCQPASTSW